MARTGVNTLTAQRQSPMKEEELMKSRGGKRRRGEGRKKGNDKRMRGSEAWEEETIVT